MHSRRVQHGSSLGLTKLALPIAVLALTAGAVNTLGGLSLTNIPTVLTDTSNEGRAISHDGKYVGGLSGTANGFFYDVVNDYVTRPLAGSYAAIVTGIGYRTDTNQSPAVVQVILDGNNAGYHGQYETSDGGLTWGFKRRDNGTPTYVWSSYPPPGQNSLAAITDSDVYYNVFRDSTKTGVYNCRGANLWTSATAAQVVITSKTVSGGENVYVTGVAASGRTAGYRLTAGTNNNTLWDYPPASGTQWQFNGLDGTIAGEIWAINLDGTRIFGRSPITPGGKTLYGYKAVISGFKSSTNSPTQQSVNPLPNFSDTAGSTSLAVPYGCTADGRYAVGMNYRGIETAVLWDASSANTAIWTVNDLYGLAAANGAADIFTRLPRAYSAGTNAAGDPVITGIGYDNLSQTRAFLMTVPKWIAAIGFPGHQRVNSGANATFSLITNGTDSLTYQWYKNGTNLGGATTTALTFASVSCTGGQAGDYQVVVSNTAISAVVTGYVATLTVVDPFISVPPASHVCLVGSNTTFTVSAGGTPTVSYQWKQGGNPLSDGATGSGSTISGAMTATLMITNVSIADTYGGTYTVDVTSSGCGATITSAETTLTVLDGMPVLNSVTEGGGSYTLNVSGPGGQSYEVLYSTNVIAPLSSWKPLTTNTFSGAIGVDTYTDMAPTDSRRFYILTSP
jgi:hypothetical protein